MSDTVPGSAPDAQGDRRADEPPRAPDAADGRMAELLASGKPTGDLRRQVGDGAAPENEDLMARINALDFLNGVVGDATDAPERLGAFRITGLLGRGGMGTVYLAWQEGLEREVALKVLSPSWTSDPTMRERFRHRYEVEPAFIDRLTQAGLHFSGKHPAQPIMQVLELAANDHPCFIAAQFHPELTSRPLRPQPLFMGLVAAAIARKHPDAARDPAIARWLHAPAACATA